MQGVIMIKQDYSQMTLEQLAITVQDSDLQNPVELSERAFCALNVIDHLFGEARDLSGLNQDDLFQAFSLLHSLAKLGQKLSTSTKHF